MDQIDIFNKIPKKGEGDIASPDLYTQCYPNKDIIKPVINFSQFSAKINKMRQKRWIRLTRFVEQQNYFQQC